MDEQREQPASKSVSTGKKWGDPIDEARKQELWARLCAWLGESDHGDQAGPFAGGSLTGADAFWLTERSGPQ